MSLRKFQGAFTLIELAIVIIVLGILVAILVPKYEDVAGTATDAAKDASSSAAKSAYAIYLAKNKLQPTVTQLAASLPNSTAVATGIQVTINGVDYVVPTYSDADSSCATATAAVGNTVTCVGTIA